MPMMPSMFQPHVDIASSDEEYTITVEVPGLDERDVRLEVSADGMLTISGEKRRESEERGQEGRRWTEPQADRQPPQLCARRVRVRAEARMVHFESGGGDRP